MLTVVLSGTPAAVAACAALCLPDMNHAMAPASQAQPMAVVADTPPLPAAHAHAHHHASADPTPVAPVPARTALGDADSHACCPDAVAAPVIAAALPRADGRIAPALVPVPYAVGRLAHLGPNAHTRHAVSSAPPRPRTPLVLRI